MRIVLETSIAFCFFFGLLRIALATFCNENTVPLRLAISIDGSMQLDCATPVCFGSKDNVDQGIVTEIELARRKTLRKRVVSRKIVFRFEINSELIVAGWRLERRW
jgi:hypothetical protein